VTVVGYGSQIQRLRHACAMAKNQLNVSCELIDLRTLLPWDVNTVANVCVLLWIVCTQQSNFVVVVVAWLAEHYIRTSTSSFEVG